MDNQAICEVLNWAVSLRSQWGHEDADMNFHEIYDSFIRVPLRNPMLRGYRLGFAALCFWVVTVVWILTTHRVVWTSIA